MLLTAMRCGGLLAGLVCVPLVADDAIPKPLSIALIGDSTMASYAKPPADRPDLTGWGQVFGESFEAGVTILNHAASGRSSKSFLSEGRWEPVLAEKPDYVFIQFGHNDQPGKGDRATDPQGDFQDNLRRYVREAQAAGAKPVLVTPVAPDVCRRQGDDHADAVCRGDSADRQGTGSAGGGSSRGELTAFRFARRSSQCRSDGVRQRPDAFFT